MAGMIATGRNYSSEKTPPPTTTNIAADDAGIFVLPDGSDPYRPLAKASDTPSRPQGISFGDLADVMPSIIQETVQHDAIWSEGLGLTAAALSTKLPHTKSQTDTEVSPRRVDSTLQQDSPMTEDKPRRKVKQEKGVTLRPPLSGKEVVELFGKGRHLGDAEFIYLNKAPTRHFRPYDLVEVSQHKANPEEHWMVSCFGILHKVKGQPAESMALYEWHREAVLWSALMKIPFFKNFLVRKAFRRWRSNQRSMDFSSTRRRIECSLLQARPRFGTAVLQISKLLQELKLLQLLPFETGHCFTLSEFEFTVQKKYREGKLILAKFFKFSKMILDKTCQDSVERLRFCENQTKQDKAVFSKESLFVQRQKKEHREQNLARALEETSSLGNFVLLVDQMMAAHLLALTRANICTFVEGAMAAGHRCERDAFFTTKLIFTDQHTLTLFPPKERFLESLKRTIDDIPGLISESAKPMSELTSGLMTPDKESNDNFQRGMETTPDPTDVKVHLKEPVLPDPEQPRKSKDYFGVATPPDCIPGLSLLDLAIIGQGMVGQCNPLSQDNLLSCLTQDEKVVASRHTQMSLMDSALADIDAFMEEHAWLSDIHRFVTTWTRNSAEEWRRAQAYTIEAKLGEIRDWKEKVVSVVRMFVTNNALFLVDCESVQTDLVPRLDAAFKDLLDFTASEAMRFAGAFIKEIKGVIHDMKEKNPAMAAFADYAQQYNTYKNKMADLQNEVEYIKSLFEVIRLSCRSLSVDEEKHEEQVWQNWEAFLLQLQDAAEFVHVQMPIKTEELNATFKQHMAEACKIHHEATSGVYLDPSQESKMLLSSLEKHFDDFYRSQAEATRCSSFREKMLGKPFDVAELGKMLSSMRVRTELWKYLQSSAAAIEDWKLTVFKKFDVQKAIDKITEWQRAAGLLKQHLPQSDPVLAHWYKMLCSFKQDLPLLLKLFSDSLKYRHWRAIFLAIGQTYDHRKPYRVMDLLSFNIAENSLAINNICAGAAAEYTLEKSLVKLRQIWEERDLKIAKHITKGTHTLASTDHQDVFILIGVEELKYLLKDSQVSLQNMLVSPHLADLRPRTELWRSTLWQINELVELIEQCQSKWLFLYSVFNESENVYGPRVTEKFGTVNRKFQCTEAEQQRLQHNKDFSLMMAADQLTAENVHNEIMVAIACDPKVLSLVNKQKGQDGWRDLQGDRLKGVLLDLIKLGEEICLEVEHVLFDTRMSYPRFFFLSDNDLRALLAHPTDRHLWVPYITKLFPAIRDVTLAMTSDPLGIHKHLDLQLHADKLDAVSFKGDWDDHVTLIHPVIPSPSIGQWWKKFELTVKSTMGSMLNACLESRLQEGDTNPHQILQELVALKGAASESPEEKKLTQAVRKSFTHWLLRFPIQCILIADAVLWCRQVSGALRSGDRGTLSIMLSHLKSSIHQYANILKDVNGITTQSRARVHISNIIMQTLHHRDILNELLKLTELRVDCFDWQKVLKYSMDISTVSCLEHQGNSSTKPTLSNQYVFSPCCVEQLGSAYPYDYEYSGPSLRLVTTPLTDRCHLALVNAMKGFECGTITGPSSTGKTGCLQELAMIMGRPFFTVDCMNVTDVRVLSNVLNGMIQSGSWGVFENIHSMNQGLMCVFAQCLQRIFYAYRILKKNGLHYNTVEYNKKPTRRHSLTTLLPTETDADDSGSIKRQKGQLKLKEDTATKRRHSIVRGRHLSVSEHYEGAGAQVPLFRPRSANSDPTLPLQQWTYKERILGHLEFNGHLIPASANFACFATMMTHGHVEHNIPSTLRAMMRPTSMVLPDLPVILETLLICSGFQEFQRLGAKLISLSETLQAQFPDQPVFHLDLRVFRSLIDMAAVQLNIKKASAQMNGNTQTDTTELDDDLNKFLEEDALHKEEKALLFALNSHLLPRLSDPDQQRQVQDLLRGIIPWGGGRPSSKEGGENDPVLLDAIQNQFVTDGLQATPRHVNKVLEMYHSLQNKRGVILVGPAGSGKTVCYQTLARVLNSLHQTHPVKEDDRTKKTEATKIEGASDSSSPSSSLHRMKFKAEVAARLTLHWKDSVSRRQEQLTYPGVDVSLVHPQTLSLDEIIGEWDAEQHTWKDGLLTKLIRESAASARAAEKLRDENIAKSRQKKQCSKGLINSPSVIEKWVVMDGDVNETLAEILCPFIKDDSNTTVSLASGEHLDIPSCLSLIIETTDDSKMSPAMAAQCSVLHFGRDVVHWRLLLDSWLSEVKTKWDISNANFVLLTSLINEIVPTTINFLSQSGCSFVLDAGQLPSRPLLPGLREISAFAMILEALLSQYFKRDDVIDDVKKETKVPSSSARPSVLLSSMFLYAYIWSFGGSLHQRYWDKFEVFAHQTLGKHSPDMHIPTEGSLFSYHIDPSQGILVPFDDKIKTLQSGYTVIPQIERYAHLVDLLLPYTPLLIAGAPGIGKSAFVQNVIHPKHPYSMITFSPAFTQAMFEESLMQKLQPLGMATNPSLAPKGSVRERPVLFIDDLNCCSYNAHTGGYPNLALLRQLFARGGFYNRTSLPYQALEPFTFLSMCSPPSEPGAGGASLSPRLTRLMTVLTMTSPDLDAVLAIYGKSLTSWLEEFPAYSLARHQDLTKAILSATVTLHGLVRRHLPCTPTNPHYMFSYHDVHHAIAGLHLLTARSRVGSRPQHGQRRIGGRRQSQAYHGSLPHSSTAPPMMKTAVRLWCHEVTRTYTDRVTSTADMDWFAAALEDTVQQYFCSGTEIPASAGSIPEEPPLGSDKALVAGESAHNQVGVTWIVNDGTESEHAKALGVSSVTLPSIRSPSVPMDADHPNSITTPVSLDRDHSPLPPISAREKNTDSTQVSMKDGTQLAASIPKDRRSSREDRTKRGVSFKSGLLAEPEVFTGPLITMDQLKNSDEEKLADIIMAKFIPTGQRECDKGYNEFSDYQLRDGLRKVLDQYNEAATTKMDLAFYKEAIGHIARLTRTLATPGGNALLIGQARAVGRTSAVRLATYAAHCKLVTCDAGPSPEENQTRLRQAMKKASMSAGVNGKPIVLLVKSRLGELAMQDMCCFLKEGTCPGLYTQKELTNIATLMLAGSKPPTGSKAEIALQNYFSRVQTYLHVVISMDCQVGSLSCSRSFLQRFAPLIQSSQCVDVYEPWNQEVYIKVAEHWLQEPTTDLYTNKVIDPALSDSVTSVVSKAMAYIHLSAQQSLISYHLADYHMYSPATFLDFIDVFKSLKWKIIKEEKLQIMKYQAGLDKINEALQTIENYRTELESLKPQHQLAVAIAAQKQQEVELYQHEYDNAKGHCEQDEGAISEMQKPLEEIKKKAQAELDRVNPVYEAALHALRTLDSAALDEIRTFRKPPETVVKVVDALCLLFGEPYGWQSGKALINRDNFFQDLEFYDKTNMPDQIFRKLNSTFIQDKGFRPEVVAQSSIAAKSICMWLHAVFAFATIHCNMRPKIVVVEEAEVKLHEAQSHLGQKRVKAQEVQGLLQEKMSEYQQCVEHVNSLNRAIQAIEEQIAGASNLMAYIETQHVIWRDSLEQAQSHLSTSTGDALLVAASATYLGPMEQSGRVALQSNWIESFQNGQFHCEEGSSSSAERIPVRDNFSLRAILSSIDEQQVWERQDCLKDMHAAQNALFIRACTIAMNRHWPLILDPNDQALSWVKRLQERGLASFHEGPDPPEDRRVESVFDEEQTEGSIEESVDDTTLTDYPGTPRTVTSIGGDLSIRTPIQDMPTELEDTVQSIEVMDVPPLELMVAPSDDPSLPLMLRQAVVNGYTLVVTHMERQPMGDQFREVLKRNVTTDENGQRKILIGQREYAYHNRFKLILCSSVPLTLKGDGISPLPLGETILINMATDREGLEDTLMKDVLSSERPEYINQLRSIRSDIREQMITINQAEEDILKKIVSLQHGILDEVNMLDSLQQYQQQILTTEATLEESITLQQQLLDKQEPFLEVARHGALLYGTIKKLERINPAYHVPLWCFLRWFSAAVRLREKDLTNIAAPRARAVELMNNVTREVHRWVSQWCPEGELFLFLFAADKMRDMGEMTSEEWKVFVSGVETRGVEAKSEVDWMDDKTWSNCCYLESTMSSFQGLCQCLLQNSRQWKEYFEHQPVLLSTVPGAELTKLSVFQKAILWRIIRPDKFASICHDVTVYQLGSHAPPGLPSLEGYLPFIAPRKPLLILLPQGQSLFDPSSVIEKICSVGMGLEKNFLKVTLGTPKQLEEVTRLLKYCQRRGLWLLLANCQAVEQWDKGFLEKLQTLLEGPDSFSEDASEGSVNHNFRLFMTDDSLQRFPGILLKHSLKMSYSPPANFKTCLQYHYHNANLWLEGKNVTDSDGAMKLVHEMVFNLSFFHTVLLQRLLYPGLGFKDTYHWNEKDLYASLDYLISSDPADTIGLEEFVGTCIYGSCTTNDEDLKTVQALADSILVPWEEVKLIPPSMGVGSLLASTLACAGNSLRSKSTNHRDAVQSIFDSMKPNVDQTQLGMTNSAAAINEMRQSRSILETLHGLEMKPQILVPPSSSVLHSQLSTMTESLSIIKPFPEKRDFDRDHLNHVDTFIHSEVKLICSKAKLILSEMEVLQSALNGDTYQNQSIEMILQAISDGRLPPGWGYPLRGTGPVVELVKDLVKKYNLLTSYRGGKNVECYDVAAFMRPKMFMRAILAEHARKEFMDAQDVDFDVQVMPQEVPTPSQPPDVGAYISGFSLHNASWDTNRLVPVKGSLELGHGPCKLPVVWVKPYHKHYRTASTREDGTKYDCPVYGSVEHKDTVPFMYLPLVVKPPETWVAQRRVWISVVE